jgi:photosystem II stability/assembly factor-like uncharacterized protein
MGVFRSTDGGASWESKSRGLVSDDHLVSDNMKVRSLAINPHDHNNLVVGVWGGDGVLETETAGETWHVAGSRALRDRVRVVAFDPGERPQIFAGRAAGGAMVCANQDPEAAWRSFPDQALGGWDDFSIVSAIAVNPSDGRTIFLGVYGAGVLRSTDGGLTWKEVDVGLSVTSVTAVVPVPSLPGTLYASTNGSGIFKSTDGGATWSLHAWASPGDWALGLALDPSDPNVLYVVTQTHGLVSLPIDPGAASLCASATCGN